MTDRYQEIRDALAMGPTPGPWIVTRELRECDETVCDLVNGTWIVTTPGVKLAHWEYDAAHIAACNPDTIRELLAERDALAKAAAKYRWGINNARWIRGEQEAYVAVPVASDADLSCVAMRDAAIDAAMEQEAGRG